MASLPTDCKRSRAALTLLEILIVLALMSMLALLAAPSIFGLMSSHELSASSRDISNHLVNARSQAISKHTLTRLLVATNWPEEGGSFRKFSIWRWNREDSEFHRVTPWRTLPQGIVFEPLFPDYVLESGYARGDATSVHGEYCLSREDALVEVEDVGGMTVEAHFVEFLPTGAARIPGGTLKNVIFVLVEGEVKQTTTGPIIHRLTDRGDGPENWAQINLATLTGRVRIHRP